MNNNIKKVLLSIGVCILFVLIAHLCNTFIWIGSNNIILYFLFGLLRNLSVLFSVGICIWLNYKIWYNESSKKKMLILSMIITPVVMYVLYIVIVLLVVIIGGYGGI